jgi:hypothetical protein
VQTFLPYSNFTLTASILDRQRLGKQRVETLQILNSLVHGKGWANHPAVRMWKGYENALVEYGIAICKEWINRGYHDSCYDKIAAFDNPKQEILYPEWLNGKIHSTHRAALLFKLPEYYSKYSWIEIPKIDYYWPV